MMVLTNSIWWFNTEAVLGVAVNWPGSFYFLTWRPVKKYDSAKRSPCCEQPRFGGEALANEMRRGERGQGDTRYVSEEAILDVLSN